jgi:hypothetical protein
MKEGEYEFGEQLNNDLSLLHIYPNPSTHSINIRIESETEEQISLSIRNILGQEVYNKQWQLSGGFQEVTVPVQDQMPGEYFVVLTGEYKTRIGKFLKE